MQQFIKYTSIKYNYPHRGEFPLDLKLIEKMIRNAFIQYEHTPLTEQQYIELAKQVQKNIQVDATSDLFEIVQDVVYEYLSKWD